MLNFKNLLNGVGLLKDLKRKDHTPSYGALDIFKYIGPGLLVTVGFIDPGNWAANIATGSEFGYTLLWVVSLSTIMLIILQHNVAHLGIATGLCLVRSCNNLFETLDFKICSILCSSGFCFNFSGRDPWWFNCFKYAV